MFFFSWTLYFWNASSMLFNQSENVLSLFKLCKGFLGVFCSCWKLADIHCSSSKLRKLIIHFWEKFSNNAPESLVQSTISQIVLLLFKEAKHKIPWFHRWNKKQKFDIATQLHLFPIWACRHSEIVIPKTVNCPFPLNYNDLLRKDRLTQGLRQKRASERVCGTTA